jgi:hypothetical protein
MGWHRCISPEQTNSTETKPASLQLGYKIPIKTTKMLGPVAQAYTPSYSEGRDQEDHGSKAAPANRPYLGKAYPQKGLVE